MTQTHAQTDSVKFHRYTKPFVRHHETLTDESSKLLRKRFPKYIHKISVDENEKFIPSLSHVKLLNTFQISSDDDSDYRDYRFRRRYRPETASNASSPSLRRRHVPIKSSSQLLRVLKPMKNQLKYLTTGKVNSFIRHFPYIKTFDLDVTKVKQWRQFLFCCRVESLNISMQTRDLQGAKLATRCINEYGFRFVQRMVNRKSVKHLRVCLAPESMRSDEKIFRDLSFTFLKKIIPFLVSHPLKTFTFEDRDSPRFVPQEDSTKHPEDVLQYATRLDISGCFLSSSKLNSSVSFQNLKNLVELSLSFSARDSDLSRLSDLSLAPCLKRINFSFSNCEQAFLEYFTLPKTINSVKLKLHSFDWHKFLSDSRNTIYNAIMTYFRKDPQCVEFYNRWSEFDNLKHLEVETNNIYEFIQNTDLPARFVMPMIEHLPRLETFIFKQCPPTRDYYGCCYNDYRDYELERYYENCDDESYELKLPEAFDRSSVSIDSFLKKLQKSKLTLQKLHIQAPSLSCHNPQNIITDMPQLKSFTVQSDNFVSGGQNLLKICNDSPRILAQAVPLAFNINQLCIEDNVSLIDLLSALLQFPKTLELTLSVFIIRVSSTTLIKHLCRFLAKTKMQGSLCLTIDKHSLCSWENLDQIKTAALKNSSLRLFQIKSESHCDREGKIYMEMRRGTLTKSCDPSLRLA